uniref:Tail protein n=1 Tax=viral metagenome TaxID=1070528 RepID=A0A6M3KLR8_9ZZZZ
MPRDIQTEEDIDALEISFGGAYHRGLWKISQHHHIYKAEEIINYIGDNQLFVYGAGYEYGSWITDGGRSIGGLSPGDLIENPCHVIEAIARYAGITTTNINTTKIDTAYTASSSWKLAYVINENISWMEFISSIAKLFALRIYFDYANQLAISTHNASANFTISGTSTPGDRDIYTDSPTVTTNIIINSTNDSLRIIEDPDGGDEAIIDIDIADGSYPAATLANQIGTDLTTESALSGNGVTYTGSYSSTVNKMVISNADLVVIKIDVSESEIAENIGFTVDQQSGLAITSDGLVNVNKKYQQHKIVELQFSAYKTPVEQIVNEIYINYSMNYATGQLEKTTFITDSDSDNGTGTRDQNAASPNDREAQAGLSKTNHKYVGQLTLDVPYIRDDATAILLRNHLFDFMKTRRWICVIKTWWNALHLELNDIINIRHDYFDGIFGTAIMNSKKWLVSRKDLDLMHQKIEIQAIENEAITLS